MFYVSGYDSKGNVYVTDTNDWEVVKVSPRKLEKHCSTTSDKVYGFSTAGLTMKGTSRDKLVIDKNLDKMYLHKCLNQCNKGNLEIYLAELKVGTEFTVKTCTGYQLAHKKISYDEWYTGDNNNYVVIDHDCLAAHLVNIVRNVKSNFYGTLADVKVL